MSTNVVKTNVDIFFQTVCKLCIEKFLRFVEIRNSVRSRSRQHKNHR